MKRAIWLMTVFSVALLGIAGCGDDDSAPETKIVTPTVDAPGQQSKEQFITEADGICAEVNAALGSLSESTTTSEADAASQRADLYEGMMDRLRGLATPDDDAGLDQFLSAGDELAAAEADAAQAAQDGDDTSLAAAESDAAAAGTTFSSAATDYGFEDCGQGATTPSTTVTSPSTAAPVVPAEPVPAAPAPAPVTPTTSPGSTGTGGGTTGSGTDTGGGTTGDGTSSSGGVGPG
jgi:uncharacterized membrane protein YgcG